MGYMLTTSLILDFDGDVDLTVVSQALNASRLGKQLVGIRYVNRSSAMVVPRRTKRGSVVEEKMAEIIDFLQLRPGRSTDLSDIIVKIYGENNRRNQQAIGSLMTRLVNSGEIIRTGRAAYRLVER